MLDTRYHIVSLAAVFLALGLGILIGTIVVQDPEVLDAQDSLIRQLSDDLKRLDAQNAQSRAKLDAIQELYTELDSFANEVFPLLVSNRLFGRHVAMVCLDNSKTRENMDAVKDALLAAGASVRVAALRHSLEDLPAKLRESGFAAEGYQSQDIDITMAARILVESVITGHNSGLTQQLVDAGHLEIESAGEHGQVDSVVVISGPDATASAVGSVVRALSEHTFLLVGAVRSDWIKSLEGKASSDVTVITDSRSIPARYRLVMSLAGEEGRSELH